MLVTSDAVKNGLFEDKYGKRGTEFNENGVPSYSVPFKIEDAPSGTVSYSLVMEDKDSYPVSPGFVWIHWLAANITQTDIKENISQTTTDFLQGANSWISIQGDNQTRELSSFYGGMAPPDAPHLYELKVFALDKMLNLEKGFYLNELYKEMDGHVLAHYTLKALYND